MRLLAAALLMLAGCGCVSVPSHDALKSLTLHILTTSDAAQVTCSATATGASEITTAKHCVTGFTLRQVNEHRVAVAGIRYVGEDVAVITLSAPMFTRWAHPGPTPKPGDRIRYWGTPLGIPNVYREGIVVAITSKSIAVDLQVCHGDSGAGMFDDAGRMVGVVVAMLPEQNKCAFMVGQR